MKKSMKKILGVLILIIVAFFYGHIAKVHNIYDQDIDPSNYGNTGIITDLGVKQEFLCKEKHLDGIRIKSTVTGVADKTILEYHLKNLSTGEIVASGQVDGKDIKNSKFYEFSFDSVKNSKDIKFEFFVSSNASLGETEGIGFAYQLKTEENTKFTIAKNEINDGTMILKTVTNRFDFETFCVFLVFALYVILFMSFLYRLFK